jgi:hypothetical protein
VNAASSQQASFGRPLQSDYGATVTQALGYGTILWNTGDLNAFALTKEDADILNPWLTLLQYDNSHLYLSGDGLVFSVVSEGASEPSALHLMSDLAGVTLRTTCASGTYRNSNCPTSGSPADYTPCVNLDPVAGSVVANNPARSVGQAGQGNGCPQLRSFDVLAPSGSLDYGAVVGDERYATAVKSADFASMVTDAASSGTLHYRIVTDGLSVHYRRDAGGPCDLVTGGVISVTQRLHEVLNYFSAINANACPRFTEVDGFPPKPLPTLRTALLFASPNPLRVGDGGRLQFTMALQAKARLEIFDLQGRVVNVLFDGIAPQGLNEVNWDGTDGSGRRVATGIYCYRLRALDIDVSKKLVLLD